MINLASASYYFSYAPKYKTNSYKETTEFSKTTETANKDYWNSEKIKTTITEKTEISRTSKTPYYTNRYSYAYAPYSSWRYKEPYNYYTYKNADYRDYYYSPRYDSELGHYNWRW